MQTRRVQFTQYPPILRRLTGMVALALFCWLNALAVVPHLHFGACGQDAHAQQHQCAVTLLTKQQVDAAETPAPIVMPVLIPADGPQSPRLPQTAADHSLPPGRAPPCLLA